MTPPYSNTILGWRSFLKTRSSFPMSDRVCRLFRCLGTLTTTCAPWKRPESAIEKPPTPKMSLLATWTSFSERSHCSLSPIFLIASSCSGSTFSSASLTNCCPVPVVEGTEERTSSRCPLGETETPSGKRSKASSASTRRTRSSTTVWNMLRSTLSRCRLPSAVTTTRVVTNTHSWTCSCSGLPNVRTACSKTTKQSACIRMHQRMFKAKCRLTITLAMPKLTKADAYVSCNSWS
mmetsp:Transcript_92406/g.178102  ORF Transcript_92406/g.178102 Transcript_92406/m.178102 type:complete len:235 (-) Transcript_92406:85-789(-)